MIFLKKLNEILTINDKRYLAYLFIFTIIIAIIETAGVSVIMPFLSLSNDFSLVEKNRYYSYLYELLSFSDTRKFVILFGILILIFYFLRLILNSIYVFMLMHFINSRYDLIVNKIFKNYLSLPYKEYIKNNTSSLTKVIINEAANITEIFWFSLMLLSEALIFLFIYSVLLYIDYKITISITLIFIITGFFVKIVISNRVKYHGVEREKFQKIFYEVLNKSFNNIKMLKLEANDETIRDFASISQKYIDTRIVSSFLQQLPRFIFEFIGFSLVVLIVLYHLLYNDKSTKDLLSVVSIFILGLYRILPSVTRIFLSYNSILFQYKSLDIVHNELNLTTEVLGDEHINFQKNICLKNISFSYNSENTIKNISLVINKNDKIAFIGKSGSGKSTLVDILMGLHQINDGEIYIDDTLLTPENLISWRSHFGYIPQSVYLFDGTVAQNVAFGLKINEEKIIQALNKANIWNFLKDKDGLNTKVGESGALLSGGQKQRIAIARALYKNPDILILDEATSALDEETEANIMNEIYDLAKNKTLIIIAHRLSTIRKCDKVYKLDHGKIKDLDQ